MNENLFRILAAIIFVASLSISTFYRRKADQDSGEQVSWQDEGLVMILALRLGGLLLWFSVLGYLIYAVGFGQTSGSVTSSFRQGYAAAASIVLFILVLILGTTTQFFLSRRERRILG